MNHVSIRMVGLDPLCADGWIVLRGRDRRMGAEPEGEGREMKSELQKNLKRFMEEKDITQIELAYIIGVSSVRMSRIVNDDNVQLRPLEILNLLLYFDCKQTDLFGKEFEGYFDN